MDLFFRQLHHIDKSITLSINSIHCPASDFVWTVFSNKYIWIVMYVIVFYFLIRNLGWKKALIVTTSIVLTITCCDQLANFTKEFFARLRPSWDEDMLAGGLNLLEQQGNLYGFYSAHAANAVGFSMCSWLGFRLNDSTRSYKAYGKLIFIWGALVGISRIFAGKHFLGDVLVGFAVGLLIGLLWAVTAHLLCKKIQ